MKSLVTAGEYILMERLIKDGSLLAGKSKTGEGLLTLSGVFAAVGSFMCIGALFIGLESRYTMDVAVGITGAVCLFFAGLFWFLSYALALKKRLQILKIKNNISDLLTQCIDSIEQEYGEPIKENPKIAVLLTLAAGMLVGNKLS